MFDELMIQTSNFAWRVKVRDTKPQKGAWPKSRDLLYKFWDAPNISGTAEDTNLKFCMRIEGKGY